MSEKNMGSRMIRPFIAGCVVLMAALFAMLLHFEAKDRNRPIVTVGAVLPGISTTPGSWCEAHRFGLQKAAEAMGVRLVIRDNAMENSGKCAAAIKELADEGAELIFLCSYGYAEEAAETLARYPKISFVTHSAEASAPNLSTCALRIYQGRYLAGALAGIRTKSNIIGYVVGTPNAQANRQLNAFVLGAQRVNPKARVIVAWTGGWAIRPKEMEAVRGLVEKGADILAYHQDDATVPQMADAMNVDFIGFNASFAGTSSHCVASLVCSWDAYYAENMKRYLKGELKMRPYYWTGIETGAVRLTDVTTELGFDGGYALANIRDDLVNRHYNIFSGPLYDKDGVLRCLRGETIHDETLLKRMDWQAKGVEFLGS